MDSRTQQQKKPGLFGRAQNRVRVIRIGDFSTELCGGTHTNATGEIGLIKVLDEGTLKPWAQE